MRDIMFDIPSTPNISKCIITEDTVLKKTPPELIFCEKTNTEQSGKQKKNRHIPQNSKETA